METFLQEKYGHDIFFLTCSGAVLQYQEFDYLSAVKHFIYREKIKNIYIVNDTSCRFINGIIHKNKPLGFVSEKAMEALYIEHYFSDFKGQPLSRQRYRLAELNIQKQAHEMVDSTILGNAIAEFAIEINGIITSKEQKLFKEIPIEKSCNKTITTP